MPAPIEFDIAPRDRPIDPFLSWLLLLAGAGMRIWQYLGSPSLWLDEALLARNLLERPLVPLISEPLASQQVAPPGFLALERIAVASLGQDEWVLRLVPFAAALLGLPLFWALTARVLAGPARTIARALFAFGFPFVWYGTEVKQYSTDVTIALALTLLALALPDRLSRTRLPVGAILAGLIACWFSIPAALVLAGLGAGLVIEPVMAGSPSWRATAAVVAAWLVGAGIAAAFTMATVSTETHAFMQHFWRWAFLPLPPWQARDLIWPIERLVSIFGEGGLNYAWPLLQLSLSVVGLAVLFRSRRACGLALVGPLAAAMLAAVLHIYPLAGRLMAFVMPAMVIGLAAGIERVAAAVQGRTGVPGIAVRALLLIPALGPVLLCPPVYQVEGVRPVVTYLAGRREAHDPLYVYYGARPALDYYGPRVGLPDSGQVQGGCYREDPRGYLRELDQFRGQARVWVLMSHDIDTERLLILGYLSQIGRVEDSLVVPGRIPLHTTHGAAIYRFDLSDPQRLRQATADLFPVPPASTRECGPVTRLR